MSSFSSAISRFREQQRIVTVLDLLSGASHGNYWMRDLPNMMRSMIVVETSAGSLEVFSTDIFDLVLLDLELPDMDGCAVSSALRELEFDVAPTPVYPLTPLNFGGRQPGATRLRGVT